ncbi:ABC transporter substrate-binding protein [Massilia cavernae]|uniref:ABC transporter substrate-binding protein n=1 Tax=Massilia cavernae TaxID=2320864 RepID=UPI00160479F4|nr:ABC transporter substrate-binding protein [Massilia cavernae]
MHRIAVAVSPWAWVLVSNFCLPLTVAAQAQELRVLHWWRSPGERLASDMLAAEARRAQIGWREIDVGDGFGAGIVLRSRILSGDLPDVVQVNSLSVPSWALLGQIVALNDVAESSNWNATLLPAVSRMMRMDGQMRAAPLGVHRVNTLFYNRRLLARLRLRTPHTWDEFERVAERLRRAGVVPLAQSSEPWQIVLLFENLLLAQAGAGFHGRVFLGADESALADPDMARALLQLRRLKRWMPQPVPELDWPTVTRQLAAGGAAMMLSGDWAKGELNAAGLVTDREFGCTAAPGTAAIHLYDLDALVMLRSRQPVRDAQRKLAQIVLSSTLQNRYNQLKGSVPVLRRPDRASMDSCARASWDLLAQPNAVLVPSYTAGTSGNEAMRSVLIDELHRFFMDDQIDVLDTQRRLIKACSAIKKARLP